MNNVNNIFVKNTDDGVKLDKWFSQYYPDVPFGFLAKICRKGELRVDSKRVKPRVALREGQKIRIPPLTSSGKKEHRSLSPTQKERFESWVIYEDSSFLILNKPAGLAVQGGTNISHSIDDYLKGFNNSDDPRLCLVHRLDKDTSGILVVAKGASNAKKISELFSSKNIQKTYWALSSGVPEKKRDIIKKSLGQGGGMSREKTIVSIDGKEAITEYKVIDSFGKAAAWLELKPQTGRKHQIRAHFADLGNPILGDGKYGGQYACRPITADCYKKLHLHARSLSFIHPNTGKQFYITANLSNEMLSSWDFFGFDVAKNNGS